MTRFMRTKSQRAKLLLPVNRFETLVRESRVARRVSPGFSVALTAVMEHLMDDLIELAAEFVANDGRTLVRPVDVENAVKCDKDWILFLRSVDMPRSKQSYRSATSKGVFKPSSALKKNNKKKSM